MDAHLIDSAIYGHLWSTEETHEVFDESARLERWLDIAAALARAQAVHGIVPSGSATAIEAIGVADLDIGRIAVETRATSHSILGLIHELQRLLPESAREHVLLGTTVQDVSDTSLALEMSAVGGIWWRDLRCIESSLIDLATAHRETPMAGRTHGQPGAPITFGFKAASWLDEIGRNIERLTALRDRCLVAQFGGAVGTLGFFGSDAVRLRQTFADELGLGAPTISWLTARDRVAEFGATAAMVTATLSRIATEVFVLQRAEIDELREATGPDTVGSITMPHKRNPEGSEQIVTLARLVRSHASSLTESMVQEHERDGRGWKAEWVTLPTLCHYSAAATRLGCSLLEGIEVRPEMMLANLLAAGSTTSEQLLRALSGRLGKHQAQTALQEAYRRAREAGTSVGEQLAGIAEPDELAVLGRIDTGAAAEMTELAVAAAEERRSGESATWR